MVHGGCVAGAGSVGRVAKTGSVVKGGCVAGGDAIATPVPISVTGASAAGTSLAGASPARTAGTGTVPTSAVSTSAIPAWTGRTGPPTAGIPPAVSPATPSAISPGAPDSSRPLMLAMALRPDPSLHELHHEPYQLGGLEGLGEEGVHAHIETGLDLVLRTRADDGEGQVVCTGIGPEAGGGAEPIQPGHDDVERHDVGPHLVDHVQTLGTIGRGHDL